MKFLIGFLLLFLTIISFSQMVSMETKDKNMKGNILIVVTNVDQLGNTGKKTGYWLSEVAHPVYIFEGFGYNVDFVSPKGGFSPVDPGSVSAAFNDKDQISIQFFQNQEKQKRMTQTLSPNQIDYKKYSAVFYAGGHGVMWDFLNCTQMHTVSESIYRNQGIISSVCHGPAGLINLKGEYGQPLIQGRNITGFTNKEEEMIKLTKVVPFSLEDALKSKGANFIPGAPFSDHVVVDGRIVTGQNPPSALSTAVKVVEGIKKVNNAYIN